MAHLKLALINRFLLRLTASDDAFMSTGQLTRYLKGGWTLNPWFSFLSLDPPYLPNLSVLLLDTALCKLHLC